MESVHRGALDANVRLSVEIDQLRNENTQLQQTLQNRGEKLARTIRQRDYFERVLEEIRAEETSAALRDVVPSIDPTWPGWH